MALTAEEFKYYLKFDQLNLNQFLELLEGPPLFNFINKSNEDKKNCITAMAIASIEAGKIKGNGSKDASTFATPICHWVEWANSKGLTVPSGLEEASKNQAKNQKSYRNKFESEDKTTILSLIEMLHDFIPELPIERLVTAEPIQRHSKDVYTDRTLIDWARDHGITSKKIGRPRDDLKEKCLEKIPKKWGFIWD